MQSCCNLSRDSALAASSAGPPLTCRFELRKNVPCTLTLQNPTGERVAFKVGPARLPARAASARPASR